MEFNMKYMVLFSLLFTFVYGSQQSYNRGEMLYFTKVCNGCHGVNAEGGGIYPKLANKKKSYLLDKLKYFKKGRVSNQNQEMMVQFIRTFTPKEIEDMATFLSKHKTKESKNIDEDLLGGYGS